MGAPLAWAGVVVAALATASLLAIQLSVRVDYFGLYTLTSIGLLVLGSGLLLGGALAKFGCLASLAGVLLGIGGFIGAVTALADDGYVWWLLLAPVVIGVVALAILQRRTSAPTVYLALAAVLVVTFAPAWADELAARRQAVEEAELRDEREAEVAACLERALDPVHRPEPPPYGSPDAPIFTSFVESCLRRTATGDRWSCGTSFCAWERDQPSDERYLYAWYHLVLERVERGTLP